MESNITLTPFSSTDVDLLRHWMTVPHVAMWYPEPEDHIAWAANPPPSGNRSLIVDRLVIFGGSLCRVKF
jgi:hypothetical protein